jgi:ABC-type lipoprotein release transport system permease subunit
MDTEASAIDSSIHPQVVGWWILAALAALVGTIVVAQALARQATIEAGSYATLSALGVSRRQLVVLNMTRTLLIGAVGVIGGAVLAFLLSPLTPVGEARLADPSLGFVFDAPVFLLGAMVAIVAVLALGLWPAVRTSRARPPEGGARAVRPSQIVAFLAGAGAPPSALIGARHALERGGGRSAVPVGPALLGSVLAVTALCGTAVFGASLTHLTSTPALYGQPFDEWFGVNGTGSPAQNNQVLTSIERDNAVSDITAGIGGVVSINGKSVSALAGESLRGPVLITTTNGTLPIADDDVTLGEATLRQVGARVGSFVRVTSPTPQGGTRTSSFRVVGTAVFPPDFSAGGLGVGAVFTLGAFLGGRCNAGPPQKACLVQTMIRAQEGSFLVRAVPGPEGRAALGRLARAFPGEVEFPTPPTNLVNFGEAVNFPLIFGVVLVVFGAATLVHLLVVSVVRRREEMGLLKAIGFVRRRVAFCVSWQTTTVALVGIVVGVPVGIALGQLVWRAFARNLGVLPVAVVTAWAIVAIALGTLIVANALAIGPALVASRSRPASLLRAE